VVLWLISHGRELVADAGEHRHHDRVLSQLHGAHEDGINSF
jgi:hypothetical protein